MKHNKAKRPNPFSSSSRRSKENSRTVTKSLNYFDTVKSSLNNSPFTEDFEDTRKKPPFCQNSQRQVRPLHDNNSKAHKNISKIKESIKEILNESVKAHAQMCKLKERLESNQSFRDTSQSAKKELIEFDVSSIKSATALDTSFNLQINELRQQLTELGSRLTKDEVRIKEKSTENNGLQFAIFSLQHKLEAMKEKKEMAEIGNAKCKLCCIF